MECQVCLETFNALERRPKVLPCGHTYCLRCLKELPQRNCPTDRKAFTEYPDNLVDNFLILNVSDKLQPSLWCSTCQKEATSKKCLEWHTLCSMKRARKEKATPLLKSLKAAVQEASLRVETMAKVRELVLAHSSRVEQRQEKLLKAQTTLQSVVVTEHEDLAMAMADVEQALSESETPTARPSAKDGGIFTVNLTLSNMMWSANLNLKDAMVDQVCQGLDILTEGQLTWQKIDSPFSSSKSKSASSGHGFSFGGATSSSSGPAPTTSIPSFCFGSSSSGLFGASTALTTSAPSICFGSSSSGLFGASTALTTSAPSFGLGSSSSVVLSAPSASGPALTTSTPLFGLRASSTGFFDPSSSTKPTDAKAPSSAGKSQFSFGGTPATGFSLPRLSASSAAAGTPVMSSTASTASSAPTSSSSDSPSAPC